MSEQKYIEQVKEINSKAYAPYSHFHVSAVLVGQSGTTYSGVNVENVSYGGTICAERVAITRAVADGEQDFKQIFIYVTDPQGNHPVTPPCGFCRQVMAEFAPDMEVVMVGADDMKRATVRELLPFIFDDSFLTQ